VTFQERERSFGVMRRETFPCPPRRRIRGAAIVLFTCAYLGYWMLDVSLGKVGRLKRRESNRGED
jgi:hypothetical protein